MDARFQQMSSPGMTQGMDGGWFMNAAVVKCGAESALHTAGIHRTFLGLTRGGEEPDWMMMGQPVLAQHLENRLWERHVAVFATLAVADAQQVAFTVDVRNLQVQPFLQTQPTGIERGEACAITRAINAGQDPPHFVHTKHHR